MSSVSPNEIAQLKDQLSRIQDLLTTRQEGDDTQKNAFDRLYEEMEQYKQDFIFQTEKPLLLDLILFFDSLNWFKQSLLDQETSRSVLSDSFQYLIDEFLELLYRRDVLPQESRTTFDPLTQRAVQVVPTNEVDGDQRVQKILKRGFTRAGRPLRAEEVVVQRYQKPEGNIEELPGDSP